MNLLVLGLLCVAVACACAIAVILTSVTTDRPPHWAISLHRKMDKLMALVQVEQTDLDNIATSIETAKGALQTLLANPVVQQLPVADLNKVNQALADLQSLELPTPAPADQPPADQPPTPTPTPADQPPADQPPA